MSTAEDARKFSENLGINHTLPIKDLVASASQTLSELFIGKEKDVTEENLQARARGVLLMAISNKFGALLLTTETKVNWPLAAHFTETCAVDLP